MTIVETSFDSGPSKANPRAGEMAALVRSKDWSRTSLGPMESWPQTLRTTVDMLLAQPVPMIVLWGPELVQIYNDGFREIAGRKHPLALGQPTYQCWPEVAHVTRLVHERVLRGESVRLQDQPRTLLRNGTLEEAFFNAGVSPLRDDEGRIAGMLFVLFEITQQVLASKRAAEALRMSEQRFEAAFEQAVVGMVLSDLEGRIQRVNSAFCAIVGRTQEELVGRDSRDFTHPADVTRNVDIINRLRARTAPSTVYEKRYLRKDGTFVHSQVSLSSVRDGEGAPVALMAVVEDISERKRSDESLARLAEQRRLALDAAQMGWWHYDLATGDVIWDDRARAIFGVSGDRTEYHDTIALMHPDDQPVVDAAVRAAIDPKGPRPYSIKYRVLHKDGTTRWVHARGQPYFAGEGEGRRPVSFVGTVADITDKKAAEDALRASEARFRQLAESMPQMMFAAGPDGQIDYFNRQWYAYTGLPEGEVGYESWKHVHTEEGLARVAEAWPETLRTGKPYQIEYRLRRHDGQYRWHLGRATAVRDEAGNVVRWFGTNTDIHDQKMTEEALRRSREQMELVVRGANVGVWYCPLPLGRLIWDEKVKEHFHLPPDAEVTIDDFFARMHPDDHARVREAMYQSINQREPYDTEYRTLSPDGRHTKWIRAVGRAFYDAEGKPLRFDGITVDVTEQVNAETALRQSEQRLRTVLEQSPVGIAIAEAPSGRFLFANPQLKAISGRNPMSDSVETYSDDWRGYHLDGRELEPEEWPLARAVRKGEVVRDEVVEMIHGQGHRVLLSINAAPVLDAKGAVVAGVVMLWDVTEQRRNAQEREELLASERAARAEAERASRLKDDFLATVSHELRTPLNAILGYAQLLRHGAMPAHKVNDGLEVIERNARVQAQIIEDILDMSRIVSGKLRLDVQQVELLSVVDAAMETVRPAADAKNIRVIKAGDLAAAPVSGDPGRLQQVIWNLLTNAIKFTPKGGRVQITLARSDAQVEVSVRDDGQGIKPEFLPHVFDKFRQADASTTRKHGGLGLGLAIVRNLVEMHGGSVGVKSAGEGKGATFTVTLPLLPTHALTEAEDNGDGRSSSPGMPLRDRPSLDAVSVLVVDDEHDARELVRRLLEDCGARVITAGSAQEALEVLDGQRMDVLVSDIGMPGEDGYELVRRVRARGQARGGNIPAAALTAFARSEDRTRALRAGYQTHIAKPVEPVELVFAVASLAGKTGRA